MQVEAQEIADLPQVEDVEDENQIENEEERAKKLEWLERKQVRERKRKERDQQIAKREKLEETVKKFEERVGQAQQSLGEEQAKLEAIVEKYGEELIWFEDATEGAEEVFLAELQEGMGPIVPEQAEDAVVDLTGGEEDVAMVETAGEVAEQLEPTEEQAQEEVPGAAYEVEGVEPVEGALPETGHEEGGPQIEVQSMETTELANTWELVLPKITEEPIRIIITLKKPLDKFYASNTKTTICDKEVIENTSMIIMEYGSKYSSEDNLKLVNEILEGPWKDLRRNPDKLLNTPFSTEKTIQYLIKRHVRQKVSDTTIEKCQLCENSLRRMVMERHLKLYCMMREEACKYCEKVLIYKNLKEHHGGDCPKYIVPCPQRCFQKNLERCQVEDHLNTCKNSVVDCRFKHYGCKVKVKRKDISRHIYDDVAGHLDLLEGRLELLTGYLLKRDPSLNEVINPTVLPEPEMMHEDEAMGKEVEGGHLAASARAPEA